MAATSLNKIVEDIKNIMRGGRVSDDEAIDDRQIKFWVHTTRATLIRQDLNKNRTLSDNLKQSLGCITMSQVDGSLCCGITTNCIVYKSSVRLPRPIELNYKDLYTRFAPVQVGAKPFHLVPFDRIPYMGHTPFDAINRYPVVAIKDRYIYLFSKEKTMAIERITAEGIWADPTEVASFNNCDDATPCYSDNNPYPISEHMIDALKKMILETNIKLILTTPTDNTGNANFDLESNSTKQ